MICITTKCTAQCTLCKSCHYAIEQMTAFVSGSSNGKERGGCTIQLSSLFSGGMCPKLEGCITNCIKGEDIKKVHLPLFSSYYKSILDSEMCE